MQQAVLNGNEGEAVAHLKLEGVGHEFGPMLLGVRHPVTDHESVKVH
jgi:hypothetical protein